MSPDGPTSPPPEEKLLSLIRKQARATPPGRAGAASAREAASGAEAAAAAMPQVVIQRVAIPWSNVAVWIFGALLAGEVVWLIAQALQPLPRLPLPAAPPASGHGAIAVAALPQDLPSLAASASPALFQAHAGAPPAGGAPKGSPSAAAKQLAARLTLMGTVDGNPPQAIIEDGQTKKSYLVSVGQAVVEGAVLERVSENRVTLDLEGEKIELSL